MSVLSYPLGDKGPSVREEIELEDIDCISCSTMFRGSIIRCYLYPNTKLINICIKTDVGGPFDKVFKPLHL